LSSSQCRAASNKRNNKKNERLDRKRTKVTDQVIELVLVNECLGNELYHGSVMEDSCQPVTVINLEKKIVGL